MKRFEFSYGPRLIAGAGSAARLGELLPAGSCLFVTDSRILELGLADGALGALEEAGVVPAIFDGVEQDPSRDTVMAAVAAGAGRAPLTSGRIQLVGDDGRALELGVRTELGKHLAQQFGDDAQFWDRTQCVIERLPDGRWQVLPVAGVANETLLNGDVLAAPRPLHDGDVLAVGRKAKGIVKLPLTVRAV